MTRHAAAGEDDWNAATEVEVFVVVAMVTISSQMEKGIHYDYGEEDKQSKDDFAKDTDSRL